MKKIKILHVAQAAGGVDRYLRMLIKYMDHSKFENIVVLSQDYNSSAYENLDVKFEQVEMNREIGKSDICAIKKIRNLIKQYHPDIVYAHSSKAGAIVRIADWGMKNHCVYNPHGWAFNMGSSKRKLYRIIEKIAAPFCEKIICISQYEKESALKKHICREEKLQVICNGVDIQDYESRKNSEVSRKSIGIGKDAFVVGMVGRLAEQKAPDVFMKAATLIKENFQEAFFLLVGEGSMESEIFEYARRNGIEDSLIITGWVVNPMDYVDLFDVAVLTSRWEGFGLVLAEYMMAGKPIVATKVDAIPDIVKDGYNGLLVDVDDYYGVYEAVKKIKCDSAFEEKLITNGLRIVHQKFDVRRVALEHEHLFEMIMANSEKKCARKHYY